MTSLFKTTILLVLIALPLAASIAQNCSLVSGTKDKKNGTETVGGITSSKDFYSLLIQKKINHTDTAIAPKYTVFLTAASKVLLSDSMLTTKGTFEFMLLDNSTMTINNVTYENSPFGFSAALGFYTIITEEQIKALAKAPIVTLKVNEVGLTTIFAPKKQKQLQTICDCLLYKYPN
jgi:hypothetical protein